MANKEIKIPLLGKDDIEVKVKQVTKAGALGLLYKTARTDRKYLNQVYGPLNWSSDYRTIKDNLYCGIGVREDSDHDFVWKWDCGIESRADDEGNEKKGEASDAFKRAGFQWGIGEELYTAPFIWLDVETVQDNRGKWVLKSPSAHFEVGDIEYDANRNICHLTIVNNKGTEVFSYTDINAVKAQKKPVEKQKVAASINTSETPKSVSKEPKIVEKATLKELVSSIGKMIKSMYEIKGDISDYSNIVIEITGDGQFKCNQATEEQYDIVEKIYNRLVEAGYGA